MVSLTFLINKRELNWIMGTELSKLNIKENSLIVQLQELNSYMIQTIEKGFEHYAIK